MRQLRILAAILILLAPTWANTPGKHTVLLQWTPGACSVAGTCTTNVYRATTANVCAGQPTPLAVGISTNSYVDLNPPTGAVFYNVSNVDPGKGGESTCNGEVQVTVQAITTAPPTGLTGTQT